MAETMTLTLALQRLHAAGRIKSPWLPGMLTTNGARFLGYDPTTGELVHSDPVDEIVGDGLHYVWPGHEQEAGWTPDLTDPATLGCLLALGREASGNHRAFVSPSVFSSCWVTAFTSPGHARGDTEGAALSAALIALAEGL